MIDLTISGGGRFEHLGGYARVRRRGPHVFIAGTTAIEPSGRLHRPGDTYAQSVYILRRFADLLDQARASLADVVLTRAYLADIATAGEFARAHGETFAAIRPVTTAVQAGLTMPGLMIEIEAQALVAE